MAKTRHSGPMKVGTETVNYEYVDEDGRLGQLGVPITATADELNASASVSGRVQEVTATANGTVAEGVQSVELNHTGTIAAAVIADFSNHQGIFSVKDTSATGTAAHTLTLTSGTFNGTNNVATLNALNESLVVYVDSAGNGTILVNVGSVALS